MLTPEDEIALYPPPPLLAENLTRLAVSAQRSQERFEARKTLGDFHAETQERNIVWKIHALRAVRVVLARGTIAKVTRSTSTIVRRVSTDTAKASEA